MTKDKEKQLFQIQNILDTLEEATEHFIILIKNKELNQSVFMFSSIVEGSQVAITMLNKIDESFKKNTNKLENYLFMIASELEKKNFIKIAEIVQFSLRPHLVRLNQTFIDVVGNQKKDKVISIGVFHSWANPRKFLPDARLKAIVGEANKQNSQIYFFTSDDVDFENELIHANIFHNDFWKSVTIPFPDVIDNIGGGRISQTERKLRREIPFTSFHVGNKYTLPKRMIKYREYIELLVPFRVCINESGIYGFLEDNNRAVFKNLRSNRGENIYFITKKGNRYVLLDQKKERILSEEALEDFIHYTILKEKGSFIIQRYIHTRTKADEPFHFRSHVQKNGEGKWQITNIFAAIGNKKSNLSNISNEVRIKNFPKFLRREHGEKQGALYEKEILKLSIDVATHLDKIYGFGINELGLDFAIDETGKIWMHEANNGPQTNYHEEERAVHTISYAKYIANNGIMYTDSSTKSALVKGQFQARTTKLPFPSINNHTLVGMLTEENANDSLSVALAYMAEVNKVSFYYFTQKDIDFDRGLIRGYFYEKEAWTKKVTEYPDVIIDRLNTRGSENNQILYEEFEDIPFTNEWPAQTSTQLEIYESIHSDKEIESHIADYRIVNRLRNVFQFIEKYDQVLLKTNNPLSGYDMISIERFNDSSYLMIRDEKIKTHSEISLRHAIREIIEKDTYIVQHDLRTRTSNGDKHEFHIHLMKNPLDEWNLVSDHATIHTNVDNVAEIRNEVLSTLIEDLYGTDSLEPFENEIKNISVKTAYALENKSETPISEVALILAVDKQQQLNILDINPKGPKKIYDEELLAQSIIPYAKSLGVENIDRDEF